MRAFLKSAASVLPFILMSQLGAASGFPGAVVEVNSEEGQARLARATVRADFESLAYNFEAQTNHKLSGLASAAIVLNALRASSNVRPATPAKPGTPGPAGIDLFYYRYTQQTFFNSYKENEKALKSGFELRKYARALRANRLRVDLRIADKSLSDAQIRSELITNLSEGGNYVLINYNRIAFGQIGSGVISPLGAYDERSDSFLVLDVNPSVAPWIWVKSAELIAAMRTKGGSENRGYVLISDSFTHGVRTASR
jgi:hypothetical protein